MHVCALTCDARPKPWVRSATLICKRGKQQVCVTTLYHIKHLAYVPVHPFSSSLQWWLPAGSSYHNQPYQPHPLADPVKADSVQWSVWYVQHSGRLWDKLSSNYTTCTYTCMALCKLLSHTTGCGNGIYTQGSITNTGNPQISQTKSYVWAT